MRFIGLLLVICAMAALTGCGTAAGYVPVAQDVVLPRLDPEHRAAYRKGLVNGLENFDENYDEDGFPWDPETNPKPSDEPEPVDTDEDDPDQPDPEPTDSEDSTPE